ncbi:MAG: TIGR01777 family oxidoreductase [Actinomycetota bacterium]|nr:TIGR01777 family oxidoreductase [Actinomycetota bacterium]
MRIVLAGASGLIGSALRRSLLADGADVTTLVRRAPRDAQELRWDPAGGHLETAALEGAHAVVCLSGAGVGDKRWTAAYKAILRSSRIDSVATIAAAMARVSRPPVLLAASAVGYYGDTGENAVNETATAGDGFLAELCEDWERAAAPAAAAGARVAHLRTGLVLTHQGGLLKRLLPIVRAGVGGRLGSGRQFMPWISMADEVSAIRFLLDNEIRGPVNLCGPNPSRNAELISMLAALVHRPAALPVPGIALRLALGEFAGDALASQRVLPTVLDQAGFVHSHTELESALRWALEN